MIPIPGPSYGTDTRVKVRIKMRGAAGKSNGASAPSDCMGGAGAGMDAVLLAPHGTPLGLMVGWGGQGGYGDGGGCAMVTILDVLIARAFMIAGGGGGSSRSFNPRQDGGGGGITSGEDGGGPYSGKGAVGTTPGAGGIGPYATGSPGGVLEGGYCAGATGTRPYGGGGLGNGGGDSGGGGAGLRGGGGAGYQNGVRGGSGGGGSGLAPAVGLISVDDFPDFIEVVSITAESAVGVTPGLDGDAQLGAVAGVPVVNSAGGDARICVQENDGSWTTYDYTGADQFHSVGSTL
jgi:hypothetical protein